MPQVTVHYYHRLRDLTGKQQEVVRLDDGATVQDLLSRTISNYPNLLPLRPSLLVARNNEYAGPTEALAEGDTVDLMPPVSGG